MLLELKGKLRGYYLDLDSFELKSYKSGDMEVIKRNKSNSGKVYYHISNSGIRAKVYLINIFKDNIQRIEARLLA